MEEKVKELEGWIYELERRLGVAEKDITALFGITEGLVKTIEKLAEIQ